MGIKVDDSLDVLYETETQNDCNSCEITIGGSNTETIIYKSAVGSITTSSDLGDDRKEDIVKKMTEKTECNSSVDASAWNSPSVELNGRGLNFVFRVLVNFLQQLSR